MSSIVPFGDYVLLWIVGLGLLAGSFLYAGISYFFKK